MLNVITITGRLVETPELHHTKNGTPVTTIRIAVKRDSEKNKEDDTNFFDVIAWRSSAEFACEHFRKGSLMQAVGRLENRKWTDRHNQARVTSEIKAEKLYFGESKGKEGDAGDLDPPVKKIAASDTSPPAGFDPFD